jgi:16S rRNA (guanine527-N7)-methyltransferase
MNKEEFLKCVKELNIDLTEEQLKQLEEYYDLLIEWNNKINLTTITNKGDVYLKHFYDSLTLIKAIDLNKIESLCDIGTGAGFPGLVLKICFPKLKVTLVDSLNKRIIFLKEVINKLNLQDVTNIHSRAEEFARKNREYADVVTCRAVSKLNIISELCLPIVKVNGLFIPMKANIEEEIKNIGYLEKLNSKIEDIINFKLPKEGSIRNLIKIRKLKETSKTYPRNFDKIINNSL